MEAFWFYCCLILSGCAVLLGAFSSLQVWEHRRFARRRLSAPKPGNRPGRVAVFAPCKGIDLELADNLRPLFEQDYGDYELTFAVEASDDPACDTIRKLLAEYPAIDAGMVVAGKTSDSGQKVHNLIWATATLRPEVQTLVFVDSDARPPCDWLRMQVQRLDRPISAAATGYRWFVPMRPTLANHVLYSINAAVATLFGVGRFNPVWGGSWAVRREAFEAADMRGAWLGTLSDDLVAARVLRQAGLRIEFEPACLLPSPIDTNWRRLWSFVRRQYLVGRFYARGWWAMGLLYATVTNLGLLGGAALTIAGTVRGAWWTWLPAAMLVVWYALSVYRGLLRRRLIVWYLPHEAQRLSTAAWFDVFAAPLVTFVNWMCMLSSLVGQSITWRGTTYGLAPDGRILYVRREETPLVPDAGQQSGRAA